MCLLTFVSSSRGKKIFRKFSEQADGSISTQSDGGQNEAEAGMLAGDESRLRRPLTRSAIRPRLLFPVGDKGKGALNHDEDDEEAVTDIEDHVTIQETADDAALFGPQTPRKLVDGPVPGTPEAPKFGVSPPTTARVTRSGVKPADDATPMKPARGGKKHSPFDGWRRVKGGAAESSSQKRPAGETLGTDIPPKRARA